MRLDSGSVCKGRKKDPQTQAAILKLLFKTTNKQVRGAYMVSERQRAQKMGYPSPIHDTIEATHACYDGNVQMALEAMARGEKVELLVASHNQVGACARVCGSVDRPRPGFGWSVEPLSDTSS